MDLWVDTNVSEEHTASIFRAEDVGNLKSWYLPTSPHGVTIYKTKHRHKIKSPIRRYACNIQHTQNNPEEHKVPGIVVMH
jgi:hypothetical protein